MIDKHPQDLAKATPERRTGRRRTGLRKIVLPLFVFFAIVFGSLAYTGQPVTFPRWATDWVEDRMNAGMGQSQVRIGDLELRVIEAVPRILMRNVVMTDPTGASLGQLNAVRAGFAPDQLLQGIVAPSSMTFSGAQITIRRAPDGRFTLTFGGSGGTPDTLPGILDQIDRTFSEGPLRHVRTVHATDLTITLEDARIGRLWQATNGSFQLDNGSDSVSINVLSEVFNGTEDLGRLQFSFQSDKRDASATLSFQMSDMTASDIAAQAPVLGYLDLVDAPIDGALRTVFTEDGALETIAASLEIGQGAFKPGPGTDPIGFSSARAFFDFDAVAQKLTFTEASVITDVLSLTANGQAYVDSDEAGRPKSLVGQLRFTEANVASGDILPDGAAFGSAGADFRLTLDPFSVELGQGVIDNAGDVIFLSGHAKTVQDGWDIALDARSDAVKPDRLLRLWPGPLIPETRAWLVENLLEADLSNVAAAVRVAPGMAERAGLSFDYKNARVRVLDHFPPVDDAFGHAVIHDDQFSITIEGGQFDPGAGGKVDVAGSSVQLEDLNRDPPWTRVQLKTDSTLEALLTIMDNEPFEVLKKAELEATVAEARAIMEGDIRFLLKDDIQLEDVSFEVAGTLLNASSETLVEDRVIIAPALDALISPEGLQIAGAGTLDGLPFEMTWVQPFGDAADAGSRLTGSVELSERALDTFEIALPPGTLNGQGSALVELAIPRDADPVMELTSDLVNVGVSVPALAWQKSPAQAGNLLVTGTLGDPVQIDQVAVSAPGFSAEGTVELGEGSVFQSARFDNVQSGNWFQANVEITGQGEGNDPLIAVVGGEINLREAPFEEASSGGDGSPLSLSLDRLRVAETIAIAPFQADLSSTSPLRGTFSGRVNGGAAVRGSILPTANGTAFRILGNDAGDIMRDAGVISSLNEGSFDMILQPRAGAPGFDGRLEVRQTRLSDQPALAALLDAVSIVGILDELNGPGIYFETLDATFRILPQGVIVDQSAAVGASLGVSLDGYYEFASNQVDMQGVVSPIYILNGIGQIFTRRGEGLFGFAFNMTGNADSPRVAVNPLSILTPGMFREIFRRPPPNRAGSN